MEINFPAIPNMKQIGLKAENLNPNSNRKNIISNINPIKETSILKPEGQLKSHLLTSFLH
jgi:hypothetical protein